MSTNLPAFFDDGERIVVAVSGGVDSMALLSALHAQAPAHGWRLTVAHFNHQLRGKAGDADERLVRRAAKTLKLPFVVGSRNVRAEARRRGWSVEMAARHLRHKFLARTARKVGAKKIALAHHADDQVESFFLRLLRGAGGEGLAGMKPLSPSPADKRILVTRPLLAVPKDELLTFAAAHKIEFSEDATNASLEMARNRIRHKLLPLLRADFQPALNTAILRVMDIVGAESEAVGALAATWLKKQDIAWDKLPLAVQRRVIQAQLFDLGVSADFDLVERLRNQPNEPFAVAPGRYIVRDSSGSVCRQARQTARFLTAQKSILLRPPMGSATFAGLIIAWEIADAPGAEFSAALNTEQFDADKVGESVVLRHWRPGDRFQPIGAASARKLQDIFTDLKTPKAERRRRVVAATAAGEIFWAQGVRMAERFKLRARTGRRLVWRWKAA